MTVGNWLTVPAPTGMGVAASGGVTTGMTVTASVYVNWVGVIDVPDDVDVLDDVDSGTGLGQIPSSQTQGDCQHRDVTLHDCNPFEDMRLSSVAGLLSRPDRTSTAANGRT